MASSDEEGEILPNNEEEEEEEEDDCFDYVCAICDNGGNMLICDGKCMRSFHATVENGCASLCLTDAEQEAMKNAPFICDNCKHKKHQCFACGELGSSDALSDPEVFFCANGACGYFYHPQCVAKLLRPGDRSAAEELQKRIAAGEPFACPIHICKVCKGLENRLMDDLQFAVCRRCPKAYHRKCLPRGIAYENGDKYIQRAWQGLIPRRVLIYCLDHEMDEDTMTPKLDHLKFPGDSRKRSQEMPTCPAFNKQRLAATRNYESEPVNSRRLATANTTDNTSTLDADARRRVLTFMEYASSSVTLEEVKRRHKPPSTYSRFYADQVTLGKVEGSIQAVRAALKKLDRGSVQDAKTVCGNELLEQVFRWQDKLKVYLAPFLYGMRYTSFGRHFTKMEKLKEIVDLLHWYIQDGDMLVDFCCGSNDFSWLMKEKLDEMGKICSFKNYDILQAKNDFNFEQRDWMSVKNEELPDGSKLIMGLNPPFGINATLANKFINKALQFKPKLLILIVPRETQRLDEKDSPYDLIWEDDQMLAGKSFYLPGSVDANGKQLEDWNVNAPVLYLWSRPPWTPHHRAIAQQHSHRPDFDTSSFEMVG